MSCILLFFFVLSILMLFSFLQIYSNLLRAFTPLSEPVMLFVLFYFFVFLRFIIYSFIYFLCGGTCEGLSKYDLLCIEMFYGVLLFVVL